jgi:hypothetical protein
MLQRSFFALGALLLALSSPSLAPASDTVSRMCHRNDDFTILEKANEGVGTTFTIRKTTPSFKADCTFEERPTDTVIGQNGSDDAFYYIALRGDHLILDEGTSPDRWLAVFDVRSGRRILAAPYWTPSGGCPPSYGVSDDFRYDDSSVTFWRLIKEPATAKNCPVFREAKSIHMTPTLVEKSIFHFGTMKMESLKARRCMIPQGEYSGGYMINGVRQD